MRNASKNTQLPFADHQQKEILRWPSAARELLVSIASPRCCPGRRLTSFGDGSLYCNADTLFSDFSGGAKEAPSSSFSLLKKMDGSEHYAHHFDGYFIDGIGSYDVSKSKWGLGCQSDSDCKPFTDAAGMTSLPKADVGNVPCCSFYAGTQRASAQNCSPDIITLSPRR